MWIIWVGPLILMALLGVFAIFPWLVPLLLVGWLLFYFAGGILFWVCSAFVALALVLVIIEMLEGENIGRGGSTTSTYDDPNAGGWY